MEFSENGVKVLKEVEGFRANRYRDIAGVETIGYGTVCHPDTPRVVTEEQAAELLRQHVIGVVVSLNGLLHVPLTQNQFDALVIFCYNIGVPAFSQSTMLRCINKKDFSGAIAQFPRWVFAGGKVSPGLANRRAVEKRLFTEN